MKKLIICLTVTAFASASALAGGKECATACASKKATACSSKDGKSVSKLNLMSPKAAAAQKTVAQSK